MYYNNRYYKNNKYYENEYINDNNEYYDNDDYYYNENKNYDINNDEELSYYQLNSYDEDEYYEKLYKENKYKDDMIDDDNVENIDDDLVEYFSDARVYSNKKNPNKKRNKRIIYKIDDNILVLNNKVKNKGIILFGPYDVNKKNMYQIELANGDIIEADEKHISYQ